jgi:uncharacterized membrane protein YhhN
MGYRVLADLVLVLHLAFILFVVLGGLLVLRWRRLIWLHAPSAIWGVVIEFMGWPCPLTPLEKHLRRLAGEEAYQGDFIEHYLTSIIYPSGLSRGTQFLLGMAVLLINTVIYIRFFRSRRRQVSD